MIKWRLLWRMFSSMYEKIRKVQFYRTAELFMKGWECYRVIYSRKVLPLGSNANIPLYSIKKIWQRKVSWGGDLRPIYKSLAHTGRPPRFFVFSPNGMSWENERVKKDMKKKNERETERGSWKMSMTRYIRIGLVLRMTLIQDRYIRKYIYIIHIYIHWNSWFGECKAVLPRECYCPW